MKLIILLIISFFILIQNLYALQTESTHFIYYYEIQDSSIIEIIKLKLEGNYERITGDLQITIPAKISVHIYPTLKEFHAAIGQPNAPDWLVGTAFTSIYVVSPLNPGPAHSYSEMLNNVLVHEFTHICTFKINSSIPAWLAEGFACFEAGPYYSKASVVSSYNTLGKIPSLDDLSGYDSFVKYAGYSFSLTIAHFAIETYGMNTVVQFIQDPSNFSVFSGLTKTEFQDNWFKYVKENYLEFPSSLIFEKNLSSPYIFNLGQNYPNPFNPETNINYSTAIPSIVKIELFDILGRKLESLINEEKSAGSYTIKFKANNLPSGIYFYFMEAAGYTQKKKMLLLR